MSLKGKLRVFLAGTVLGSSQLMIAPAHADEEQLQRQIDAMKRQLDAMQKELAQSRKQSAQRQAGGPPPQTVTARNGNEIIIPSPPPPAPAPADGAMPIKAFPSWFDGIHVSMAGSYVAMEGVARQHNEVANGASNPPFGSPGIPLQNSALYTEREFRASVQQSRIALKVTGRY